MQEEGTQTLRGLDTVRVTKEALLSALEQNRAEHREIFVEAIDAWQKRVIERLNTMVEQAKRDPGLVELAVGLPRPDDHTKDYNRVIRMIEMSQDDEFELSSYDFAQFVMDEWGWQAAFLTASSNYSPTAKDKYDKMNG